VRARIVKNKVAPPFRVAEFDIMFNEGISREGDVIDIGVEKEVIKKSGSFYSFKDTRLGQGRENSKAFLREHREITEQIEALIKGEAPVAENGAKDSSGEDGLVEQPVVAITAEQAN
ncbi:MAG: DNA recombination/repair protein RecA, partial [Chloroflexi bacterium]|nr:DNA recombination/repair protein RecA [Chloroflexota bacterium]